MLKFAVFMLVVSTLLLLYVFVLRPRIRELPGFHDFFDKIEPYEQMLWLKSRSILVGRLYMLAGILIGLHDALSSLMMDWTPFLSMILDMVPDDKRALVQSLLTGAAAIFTGIVINQLRGIQTKPLSEDK